MRGCSPRYSTPVSCGRAFSGTSCCHSRQRAGIARSGVRRCSRSLSTTRPSSSSGVTACPRLRPPSAPATLIAQMRAAFNDAGVGGWEGLDGTYGLPGTDDGARGGRAGSDPHCRRRSSGRSSIATTWTPPSRHPKHVTERARHHRNSSRKPRRMRASRSAGSNASQWPIL